MLLKLRITMPAARIIRRVPIILVARIIMRVAIRSDGGVGVLSDKD